MTEPNLPEREGPKLDVTAPGPPKPELEPSSKVTTDKEKGPVPDVKVEGSKNATSGSTTGDENQSGKSLDSNAPSTLPPLFPVHTTVESPHPLIH